MASAKTRPRKSSPLNLPSAFELFGASKELVLKNIWIFGPLYAVPVIYWVHSWIWTSASTASVAGGGQWWGRFYGADSSWGINPISSWSDAVVGFSIIWFLIAAIGGTIAQLMVTIAALEATEHKVLDFQDLWRRVKHLGWRLIGLYIVVSIYVIVGLILLIVPGLIMIRRYFLAPYVMIDKDCGINEAMERSAAMSKPYSGSVWGILGVMLLISFVGIVPLIGGIVALILSLFYIVAPALRYQQLKKLG